MPRKGLQYCTGAVQRRRSASAAQVERKRSVGGRKCSICSSQYRASAAQVPHVRYRAGAARVAQVPCNTAQVRSKCLASACNTAQVQRKRSASATQRKCRVSAAHYQCSASAVHEWSASGARVEREWSASEVQRTCRAQESRKLRAARVQRKCRPQVRQCPAQGHRKCSAGAASAAQVQSKGSASATQYAVHPELVEQGALLHRRP